jgi:hypothetical protein
MDYSEILRCAQDDWVVQLKLHSEKTTKLFPRIALKKLKLSPNPLAIQPRNQAVHR